MWRILALLTGIAVLTLVVAEQRAGTSAAATLARAAAVNQAWLADVESGKTLHIVDVVYQHDAVDSGSFSLPQSYVQHVWMQYADGRPPQFCTSISSDGVQL